MTERCATTEQISAYIDNELTGRELSWLRGHFEVCASCEAEAERLRRLSQSMRSLPDPEFPDDLMPLLNQQICPEACGRRPAILGWHPWRLVPLSLAAGLTLSIGVLLGNALVGAKQDNIPAQHPMALFDLVPPGGICIGVYDCYRKGALQ